MDTKSYKEKFYSLLEKKLVKMNPKPIEEAGLLTSNDTFEKDA